MRGCLRMIVFIAMLERRGGFFSEEGDFVFAPAVPFGLFALWTPDDHFPGGLEF